MLGSVLCCPGCFSLYRCQAVRDVLSIYATGVDHAFDFLTKDMGEYMVRKKIENGRLNRSLQISRYRSLIGLLLKFTNWNTLSSTITGKTEADLA